MMHAIEVSKMDFALIFRKSKKFSVCFKIICNACRTVLIQNALCYPDPGDCFTFPEHVYNMRRNFSRGLWSARVYSQKDVNEESQRSFEGLFYTFFEQILELQNHWKKFYACWHALGIWNILLDQGTIAHFELGPYATRCILFWSNQKKVWIFEKSM